MIISITSLKGGVGKSTITQNLAVCMAHNGYKVVIADADRNQSSMMWHSQRSEELPGISCFSVPERNMSANIKQLNQDYDFVLIDGTPSLDNITSKIITLSDFLIIPVQPSAQDLWATEKFIERKNEAEIEKEQVIKAKFLINRNKPTTNTSRDTVEVLNSFGIEVFESTLNDRISYADAIVNGNGIFEYKDAKAKNEFLIFYKELMSNLIPQKNGKRK